MSEGEREGGSEITVSYSTTMTSHQKMRIEEEAEPVSQQLLSYTLCSPQQ